MIDDSTVDPTTVNLEDSPTTIRELARNATMYGPAAAPLVSNPFQSFETAAASIFSGAFVPTAIFAATIAAVNQGLKNLGLSDLNNNIDPGFGFNAGSGQSNTESQNMLSYGNIGQTPTSASVYDQLEKVLSASLTQDWKTKNSSPGNPLIIKAYALSGRNYDRDGFSNEYNWNTPFVNWVFSECGLASIKNMSPQSYNGYGNPVDFGTFKNVRKNDIIIFKSMSNIGSIGFVRGFNPKTNKITVIGGNFGGTVKELQIPFSRSDPVIRVTHVRRNWEIPAEMDVPLFQFKSSPYAMIASRPEIPTTSARSATRRDINVGGSGAASGGTLT